MKRILFLLSLLISLSFSTFSQISIKSFELLETDLDASTYYPKKDFNSKTCAIIKVFTTQIGFRFDNGSLGIVATEQKTAEVWVYVPEGTMKLKIVHPQLGHVTNSETGDGYYWFPSGRVKSGCCYKMELVTGTVRTVVEEVKKKTGWLVFNSVPEGADIYLSEEGQAEEYIGVTPMSKKMPYGRYNFRIKKYNYHDDVGIAVVDNTRVTMDLKLVPAFGAVMAVSVPQGAKVYLDGKDTGKITPCTLTEVASGNHEIRLQMPDYAPASNNVTVVDGQTANVNVTMKARFASVIINSLPEAEIKVNGSIVGKGVYTANMQEGIYDVEVSLVNHKSVAKQIEVVANQSQSVELKPTPIYGMLDVNSKPLGANITINGKSYGDTPATIENLLVGDYDVVLTKTGYASVTQRVSISENRSSEINATLPSGRIVWIDTDPSGAVVYVDGVRVGVSPCDVELAYGTHEISAERNGESVSGEVLVTQGQGFQGVVFGFGLLSPNWNSSVTEAQRTVLERLIANMVKVKGGTFTMGATSEQRIYAKSDESPTHSVTLSDYYIGRYEVTQGEWIAVMGTNPSSFTGMNHPVDNVSWEDCQTFITKLKELTGMIFRLPTEAEWEYAARGGNKSKGYKYSGSNTVDDVAWSSSNSSSKTHEVGTKVPNELGIYDMSGNVYEWCSDWYGIYSSSSQSNPTGPNSGSDRVLRGGSWAYNASGCRVSFRDYGSPSYGYFKYGFRLVAVPLV